MYFGLRFRLLFITGVVLTLTVGVVALLASEVTTRQFYRYVEYDDASKIERFAAILATYSDQPLTLDEAEPILQQIGDITGSRIALVDDDGQVLAASTNNLMGQQLDVPDGVDNEVKVWVIDQQERIELIESGVLPSSPSLSPLLGSVYVEPTNVNNYPSRFTQTVNRSLLMGVFIGAMTAMLLMLLLTRRIFFPIYALTRAAQAMEKGNLRFRVYVKSQDEIGDLARAFNAMADGLMQQENLRRNMVSDIAHELRTPLTNIQGYLEALQDGIIEPSREIIDSIHEEALLLRHLINDLQELALAEAGQLRLMIQPVTLHDILQQAVRVLHVRAVDRDIKVSLDVPANLPPVSGDPERLGQIVRNLLNNALTHTPSGGEIWLRARWINNEIEISVKDTGIGIPAEHLPHVFERFYRVDQSRSRNTGGAGLGLAIVKQLVQAQGGHIWAESQPGHGAIFAFTMPTARV